MKKGSFNTYIIIDASDKNDKEGVMLIKEKGYRFDSLARPFFLSFGYKFMQQTNFELLRQT